VDTKDGGEMSSTLSSALPGGGGMAEGAHEKKQMARDCAPSQIRLLTSSSDVNVDAAPPGGLAAAGAATEVILVGCERRLSGNGARQWIWGTTHIGLVKKKVPESYRGRWGTEVLLVLVDAWASHEQRLFTASTLPQVSSRATFFRRKTNGPTTDSGCLLRN
jgi:hypothetical protein